MKSMHKIEESVELEGAKKTQKVKNMGKYDINKKNEYNND